MSNVLPPDKVIVERGERLVITATPLGLFVVILLLNVAAAGVLNCRLFQLVPLITTPEPNAPAAATINCPA